MAKFIVGSRPLRWMGFTGFLDRRKRGPLFRQALALLLAHSLYSSRNKGSGESEALPDCRMLGEWTLDSSAEVMGLSQRRNADGIEKTDMGEWEESPSRWRLRG